MSSNTISETKPASKSSMRGGKRIKIVRSCTIKRPASEIYEFWRNFENLPKVMKHLISVTRITERESHWVVSTVGDKRYEWDAVIINEHPGELIAWQTTKESDFEHAGSVRFEQAPGNRGTQVTISFEYVPPGGKLAMTIHTLLGEVPAEQIEADLMRLKALLETGEIPTIEGQPVGAAQRKKEKR